MQRREPASTVHRSGVGHAADEADAVDYRLCAIVPVFNHPRRLASVLDGLTAAGLPVLVVDDGSDAECAALIDRQVAADASRQLLRLPRNGGKGGAVLAGMVAALEAGFSHALQVDADGQHDLGALPALRASSLAVPRALVSGRPVFDASVPKARMYGRYATHVWVWINTLSLQIVDSMCGFRIYPLAASVAAHRRWRIGRRMDFDTDLMVRMYWMGVPIHFVPTPVHYPEDGVSHFRVLRDNVRISAMHTRHFFYMLARVLTGRLRPDARVGEHVAAAQTSMLPAVLFSLLCAALTIGAAQPASAARNAAGASLPAPVLALSQRLRSQNMRCVPFVQEKHLVSLGRALRFTGELSVADDRRVLWRLNTPVQAEYQFLDNGAWRRSPGAAWQRLAVPDVASRAIHSMLSSLLDLNASTLQQQFDVRVLSSTPVVFVAVPRVAQLRKLIGSVTVRANTRIESLRIDEPSGNWSEYRFGATGAPERCLLPPPPVR